MKFAVKDFSEWADAYEVPLGIAVDLEKYPGEIAIAHYMKDTVEIQEYISKNIPAGIWVYAITVPDHMITHKVTLQQIIDNEMMMRNNKQ